jgi:hypothetical protein
MDEKKGPAHNFSISLAVNWLGVHIAVLPTGRLFGCITQKGLNKKKSCRTKL